MPPPLVLWLALVLASVVAGCGGSTSRRTKPKLIVEQTRLIYPVHGVPQADAFAIVLVRNRSGKIAQYVAGRISLLDHQGRRLNHFETDSVTLAPHSEAVWQFPLKLSRPPERVTFHVRFDVSGFRTGRRSPVSASRVRYRLTPGGNCIFTGVLSNRFTEPRENLELPIVGFVGSKLATATIAYPKTLLPHEDQTFRAAISAPALCPRLTRVEVLPALDDGDIPHR